MKPTQAPGPSHPCERLQISPFSLGILEDYTDYDKGHYLYDGGKLSQPAKWIHALEIVESIMAEMKLKQLKGKTKGWLGK